MSSRGGSFGSGGVAMHGEFMAFVGDDDSLVILREWVQRQGFPSACVQPGGPELFANMAESTTPPKIALVDVDGQPDPVSVVKRLSELYGSVCKLILIGSANDVSLYRRMVNAGAVDYLVKPLASEGLNQAMQLALKSERNAATEIKEAKTVIIMGARGGIGASTIAVNMGWLMAEEANLNVALLDLDLHFGISSLALDLEPGRGLRDILSSPHRVDGLMIASSMTAASDRFSVLATEEAVDDAVNIDGAAITALLNEMRNNFDFVIVDLPRHLFSLQKRLLMSANYIVLVTELSLAGIRDTLRLKAALKNLETPAEIILVASRTSLTRSGHVDIPVFEKSTQAKIDFVVPEDSKSMALAANSGKTLTAVAKSAPITRTLMAIAAKLTGEKAFAGKKQGLLKKIFGNSKPKSSSKQDAKK
jgi:pilus assembly protein CpaE